MNDDVTLGNVDG